MQGFIIITLSLYLAFLEMQDGNCDIC